MLMKKNSGESMEYNIYLDVFFLVNLIMNVLALKSLGWIVRKQCSWKKVILSAAIGAGANAAVLVFEIESPMLTVLTAAMMCRILWEKRREGGWNKRMEKEDFIYPFFLLFLAFCMEGAVSWFRSYIGALFIPVLSYLLGKERKKQEQDMKVVLTFKGRQKELKGFYDSGNRLMEPMTGKMVHIACYEEIKELLPEEYRQAAEHYFATGFLESTKVTKLQMYEFTFLSYHSIGKETGQLLGIRMDSAEFSNSTGKKTEEKVVIGLAQQKLFVKGHDRMIINGRLEL